MKISILTFVDLIVVFEVFHPLTAGAQLYFIAIWTPLNVFSPADFAVLFKVVISATELLKCAIVERLLIISYKLRPVIGIQRYKFYFRHILFLVLLFRNDVPINISIGKMIAVSSPVFRLSFAAFDMKPTSVGPAEQPISPASAINANIAVPAPFRLEEARLNVPGQKMPTEKPHIAQPISPATGLLVSVASR